MNGCKDNSIKYIPLYHHEQVPFQPFQDNSSPVTNSVKMTTPISNNNNNNSNNNSNTNNSSNTSSYDLQDIILCYQSQPELLKLILSSKLEEDKRRAEEAKLKAKELDLLILQQKQQLISTTPALSSPSTSSSSTIHLSSSSATDIPFSNNNNNHSSSPSSSSIVAALSSSSSSSSSSFLNQAIHNNNNYSNHNNNNSIDDSSFQYLSQPITNLMTSPTVSQRSNPFHLKHNLTNNNDNNEMVHTYSTSSTSLLNDPPHPLCSNDINSSQFSNSNLMSPISEITNHDIHSSTPPPSNNNNNNYIEHHHQEYNRTPSFSSLNNHNSRYDPYYHHQQQPRQKRKREMQAITKIVETRDYPYLDGYSWRNNGNTIQKKTGNKSVYYKCANSINRKKVFTEEYTSIYSKFMFTWVNDIMKKGWKTTLNDEDLSDMPNENLTINVLSAYNTATEIATTTTNKKYTTSNAFLFVCGLFISTIIESLSALQSSHIGRHLSIRIQALFISEVYGKSLRRRGDLNTNNGYIEENSEIKENANNLVSIDAQKVNEAMASLYYIYSLPVQAIFCVLFLYKLLGVSALYGVLVMVLSQFVLFYLILQYRKVHQKCMGFTDKRIKLTNELLNGIRIIKFFAWEEEFRKKVLTARDLELKAKKPRFFKAILLRSSSECIPILIILVVFYVYTDTNTLTASTAFTAIALFNILKGVFEELPLLISNNIQAMVSLRRLERLLNEEEVDINHSNYDDDGGDNDEVDNLQDSALNTNTTSAMISAKKAATTIKFIGFVDNASFSWVKPTMDDRNNVISNPHIQKLNLSFPLNKFSIICGPTGSGKSTLIASLLGETSCLSGRAILPRKLLTNNKSTNGTICNVAYVAQTSWIQNKTIKENILFGQPYDAERYNKILYMAALTGDLKILENGDSTEIGEKGINLSGGQKQRVAIARAIYSQADIIILDDCLSAVDTYAAKHIYQHCLMGEYMKNKTVILVTNHVGFCIQRADYIVYLKDGQVLSAGTPNDVICAGVLDKENYHLCVENEPELEIEQITMIPLSANTAKENDINQVKLIKDENREEGNVQYSIYQSYMEVTWGYFFWIVVIISSCGSQCLMFSQDYWIKLWVSAYKSSDYYYYQLKSKDNANTANNINASYYVGVYFAISVATIVLMALRLIFTFIGSIRALRSYHQKLLDSILDATVRFFDTTPLGRIVNRFSSDMETLDQSIIVELLLLLYSMIICIFIVLLVATMTPLFIIFAAVLAIIFWFIGRYYIRTSRDLKRLKSVSKTPIYAQLSETIHGITTIRAFARIELLGGLIGFFTGILFIFAKSSSVDVGLAALSLAYTLIFTRHMLWVVCRCGTCEINFVCLERIEEYINTIESENKALLTLQPSNTIDNNNEQQLIYSPSSSQWPPCYGNVNVKNLTVRYAPELPPVLHDISFQIKTGEKVGIVGKTGSGKSSLVLAFFRFMSSIEGTILIDDVNICQLSLHDLRSHLTIIPQDPVLFSGTIRSNLDPFHQYDDAILWLALKRAHLVNTSNNTDSSNNYSSHTYITLESNVLENGNNFSQGQKQLIALARALIKKSALIILDEATSSVDADTDQRIQNTIRSEFRDSTLLTVAHRLNTIIDYDRVLVLDQGKVVEFYTPYHLMIKEYGYFKTMCEKSGIYSDLLTIATSKHMA
ncbi:hypothetical protein BJ944DRAFT_239688 [Cunninghamella echinulata]|nr:hypothetical protein BJ944DRAFT_239688 [Cunninghamella echinulata]